MRVGEYARFRSSRIPEAPAEAQRAPAKSLPQKKPDPYQNVNPMDFTTAASMTQAQKTTMADVAAAQGLPGVAMEWKTLAIDAQIGSASDRALSDMDAALGVPKPMPPHGSRILEPTGRLPWESDSECQSLATQCEAAKDTLAPAMDYDPDRPSKAGTLTYQGDPGGLAQYVEEEFEYYGPPHPLMAAIHTGHQQLDQIAETAGSAPAVDDFGTAVAKAEASGDWASALSLKGDQIERMLRP